jgi:hypothetical protein
VALGLALLLALSDALSLVEGLVLWLTDTVTVRSAV